MSEFKSFSTENEGLYTMIHDTNGPFGTMRAATSNAKRYIEELGIKHERLTNSLEAIEQSRERAMKAIDVYYNKRKVIYDGGSK